MAWSTTSRPKTTPASWCFRSAGGESPAHRSMDGSRRRATKRRLSSRDGQPGLEVYGSRKIDGSPENPVEWRIGPKKGGTSRSNAPAETTVPKGATMNTRSRFLLLALLVVSFAFTAIAGDTGTIVSNYSVAGTLLTPSGQRYGFVKGMPFVQSFIPQEGGFPTQLSVNMG